MKIGDRIYVRGYIDEIRKDTVIVRNDGGYFGTVLSEVTGDLPSAQPEKRTEERTETHACDCISRQMLLEYIHGEPVGRLLCDKYNLDGLIEQFPSAQPERKKGEWISNDIDPEAWNFCSVCGEQAIDLFDFCPNCGADMRGEQDE